MQVSTAGNDAHLVLLIADQRQIERTAAEVHHQDRLRRRQFGEPDPFGSEYEAERRSHRFVDDVHVLQSRALARFGGRLPLHVTELRGNRDDRSFDLADPLARTVEHRLQNERADVDRRIALAADLPAVSRTPHVPLGVDDDLVRMSDRIPQGLGPDDDVIAVKQHDGGGRKFAVLVWHGDRLTVLVQIGETRVRRPQVDANGVSRKHGGAGFQKSDGQEAGAGKQRHENASIAPCRLPRDTPRLPGPTRFSRGLPRSCGLRHRCFNVATAIRVGKTISPSGWKRTVRSVNREPAVSSLLDKRRGQRGARPVG